MDAISCCLAPPAALLQATSFADAAIARVLHFSISSAASSSLSAPPPDYPPHVTTCCDSVLVADSPTAAAGRRRQQHKQLAPGAGRAGKQRRSRASKRAPTTYISTDPANFRIMVQQITGVQAAADIDDFLQIDAAAAVMTMAAADAATVGGGNPLQLPLPGGDHHHQQQQPCFPTLDSWNVMDEMRSELL